VNWNAEAIYFYDPADNVLEFIARKNLNIVANEKFSSKSVINISEMAMPVNDVKAHFDFLNNEFEDFSIEKYSGDYKRFCASGDEEGLFIIVDTKVKKWYPTNKPSLAFPFEIWFESNNKNYHLIEKETFTFEVL
jgi:catechol-2,3-dioxygenase